MSKKKAAGKVQSDPPNISILESELLERYVKTPLSFWEDGDWKIDESTDHIITGQIIEIKMVKNRKKDVVAVIWYEPTDEEKDCKCEIRVDVARNMLYTPDFVPGKDSFFYEDVETGSLQSNSDKDETSSKSSSRESEREVESPVVEAEVSPDVENDSDGEDEAINAAEDDNSEPQSDEDENMSERSSSDVESDNDGVDETESESDSDSDD